MLNFSTLRYSTTEEDTNRSDLLQLLLACPIPGAELMSNLGLFLTRQSLSRVFFMAELYQKALPVHGIVIDFGTRWGQNLALFQAFRGMFEPFNHNRKIVAFDTFEGFPQLEAADGPSQELGAGAYGVTPRYREYLERILSCHQQESPLPHLTRHEIVVGDAGETAREYLDRNPETIVALAYFDMDLYRPTKECLEAIRPHVTKGTVLGFDELNLHDFPGETRALREVLGLDRYRIQRSPFATVASYLVIE